MHSNELSMEKLTRNDLYSLENYAKVRSDFRARVIEHKKPRRISLGANLNLYFEDRLTMQYQVQEMLRIERIFEADAIEDELSAYNPLIPDGNNWKATMMLEYADVDERKRALSSLIGIENHIFVQVEGCEKVYAIADEDLDRADEEKTSSVHFLRFQLDDDSVKRAKAGAAISIGVDHANYHEVIDELTAEQHAALVADLG
jgi:hypothetical protein